MGFIDFIKYALKDKAREKQIAKSESGGGGKKGKHRAPKKGMKMCPYTWKDKGIPGSKHATYPHEDHICGSEPHNRGNHFCRNFDCSATTPY